MQNKSPEEIKKIVQNQVIKNSLGTDIVTAAALTMQSVYQDLQKLDDETADEIGFSINKVMCNEHHSNYHALKAISSMNYSQLENKFGRLNRLKQHINFQMKVVVYAQNLMNDPN